MNVSKTEVGAVGNSPQRDFVTTSHNIFSTINPDTGRPRIFYKYLGVYVYTQDPSKQLTMALRAEIRAYFANIDPLLLTLSEKIWLVNRQLHPMIACRLFEHCLPVGTLNIFERDIWRALQRSSITPRYLQWTALTPALNAAWRYPPSLLWSTYRLSTQQYDA